MMIVGVDPGNDSVKMYGELGEMKFPSLIGEFRERKLDSNFGPDDMIYEFNGKKGFAGTLALYESEFAGSRAGDSKAHEEMLLRVLLGLHRYANEDTFQIIVGQPISKHTKTEKLKMKLMLEKTHEITVNGEYKKITIQRAEVAAEGGSAFWSAPKKGVVRLLDFGSGTVNAASLIDGRYIDKDSFTLKYGLNTVLNKENTFEMARHVALFALKKWDCDDFVYVAGGGAEILYEPLLDYFRYATVLRPRVNIDEENPLSVKVLSPVFANAIGFYKVGKQVFSNGSK